MPTKTLITAEQYLNLPDSAPRELIRGEVVEMSPPSFLHGAVCRRVAMILGQWADASGTGEVVCNDAGVVTERDPDTVRGADCQFIRYARLPDGYPVEGYPAVPPDLVVEVVSVSDRWSDVIRKVDEYLDAGVAEVWVVEPQERFVEVHRPNRRPARYESADDLASEAILPGFRCQVAAFFPRR
jgi:Uma2 family endonuclease